MNDNEKKLILEIFEQASKLDEKRKIYLLGYLNGLVAAHDE